MSVLQAVVKGLGSAVRKPRLAVILYVFNLGFAAAVLLPFFAVVQSELGHSFLGSNVRPVDVMWLGEAALKYGDAAPAVIGQALAAALLYFALSLFLNGGVVGRLLDREGRTTLEPFFADCGRYFWRFVRIFLVSLVFHVLAFAAVLNLLSALIRPATESAVTEWPRLILSNLHFLIALLLLSAVRMIVDYARIAVVADAEAKVLRALRHALKFLGKRFFRAWAVYLLLALLTVAGTAVFYVVLGRFAAPGVAGVAAGLAWMQAYVLFRAWMRTVFVAAQAEYYRAHPY
ncbi:MAG TPA: hypothetical protein PLP83_11470 [Candidatus Aminicenantes bacterium]|nr:hypothetical protein [Candidatus Aminicenantes bacterium]